MLGGRFIKHICVICRTHSRDKAGKKKVREAFWRLIKYQYKHKNLVVIYLQLFSTLSDRSPICASLLGSAGGRSLEHSAVGTHKAVIDDPLIWIDGDEFSPIFIKYGIFNLHGLPPGIITHSLMPLRVW